ncbi:hypothetical protein H310_05715 [Aphanomyces invadans]|uniref:MORN repeat-containing protein 3 n=1 Tax=Aphanomyces invadans TaxID=157072 RepID=A0A024U8B3_9STRA|nr:hypothetical protein H310_05715 [Aphanomyces invadans]ETW02142.1 hypothetical protein H310_05715 [Aphanomyces invadans]|eukprot:XP_008868747.1 hypothetical protein H310_05715 [Aphanomyces invadans]
MTSQDTGDSPANVAALERVVAFVKKQRPRALTKEERLDILMLYARMALDGEKDVCNRVANLLGRNRHVVQAVWRDFRTTESVCVRQVAGNRVNHPTRFPRTEAVVSLVLGFVTNHRGTGVTSTEVLTCLEQNNVLQVDRGNTKKLAASIRSVTRFLHTIDGVVKSADGRNCHFVESPTMSRPSPRLLAATPSAPVGSHVKKESLNPLWKTWDARSVKSGAHHSVYWVKHSSESNEDKYGHVELGKSTFVQAAKYTGDWQNDMKCGYGTQQCASGNKYEGEWKDGLRHGKGIFWVKRNGKLRKQYTGDWAVDKREGLGVFYYEDGGKFEGFWAGNARQGKGRMTYPDGSVYEGHWVDNERSGMGVWSMPNGNRYEGYWLHDKKEGPGRFYYKSTGKVYEAEWQNDTAKCGTYHDSGDTEWDSAATTEAFTLPELELAAPESVLNDTILQLREARLKEQVRRNSRSPSAPSSVVFTLSEAVQRRVQEEFHAIDYHRRGVIRCVDIVQILQDVVDQHDETNYHVRVEALLHELGASYDTAITLPECMDIVALLMEPDEDQPKQHRDGCDEKAHD